MAAIHCKLQVAEYPMCIEDDVNWLYTLAPVRTILTWWESGLTSDSIPFIRYARSLWPLVVTQVATDSRIQSLSYSYEGKTQRCWRFLGALNVSQHNPLSAFSPLKRRQSGQGSRANFDQDIQADEPILATTGLGDSISML